MECIVLYEGWQMQCCGTPFGIADIVKWPVVNWGDNELVGSDATIHYCFEAHSSDYKDIFMIQGTVAQIDALYQKFEPAAHGSFLVPAAGFIRSVQKADGWDKRIDDTEFSSYIVLLKDVGIRPAEETEITFR